MNDYVRELIQRYSNKGIVLDSNLLLLYFIGAFDTTLISRFKRTQTFVTEDYKTLLSLLRSFNRVLTTPNILTEVSNLSGQLPGHLRLTYFQRFAQAIDLLDERYFPSQAIARLAGFRRFGLTDIRHYRQ